jgi:hypothetical protein
VRASRWPSNNDMKLTGGEGRSRGRWARHPASRVQGPRQRREAPLAAGLGVSWIVDDQVKPKGPRMAARKRRQAAKVALIQEALASEDPLASLREVIAEKNHQQKVVVWVYAGILETNSAGLTILFERFTPPEIIQIERGLVEVGATQAASDLLALRRKFESAIDGGATRDHASEAVHESSIGKAANRRCEGHVEEMEAKLLEYCRAHVEELGDEA